MAVVRKKQDDKILKTLRELVSIGGNKECFDCGQKGPTYINMTIGSFVCTTCSGILRGITPPHRVKSISMATFTQEEIDFVRQNGNDACSRTWLGLWDPKRAIKQEHRDFMIDKYERKRYYLEPASPLKSLPTNGTTSATTAASSSSSSSSSTLASATNGNGSSTNINSSTSSNNSSSSKNGAENLVPLKTITLTPPTSLRLSRTSSNSSGGLANGSHTGSSTNLKFQQQFTPDDSNFFSSDPPKILPPTPQKHSSNHHQRLNGSATVNGTNFERNQKNGLLTSTITNGINKFTPDTDFVADFSNANIIVNANPAATTTANGLKNGGSSNHRRLSNGFSENGNGLIPNGHRNGETENFADFEHNTIYNAAEQHSSGSLNLSIDSGNSTTASSSSTTSVNSLNNDLFINNYSLLNNNNGPAVGGGAAALGGDAPTFGSPQFVAFSGGGVFGPQPQRPPSNGNGYSYFQNCPQHQQQQAVASSGSSSLNFVTSANGQWNLGWPQWAPHDQQQYQQQQQQQQKQHNCTNQNRWSLPISASSRSSSALSSATPSVDRYAALKDLDDQFREIKFESETNNNNVISSSASTNGLSNGLMNGNHTNDVHQVSTANPFKTANPFQQQPQQQQQQTLSWAIPGSTPPTATNGFYASSSSPYQNGFVHPAAAAANLLNGNGVNGFTNAFHHHPSSNGSTGNINNNNGYGHIQAGVVPPYGVHHGGAVNHFGHFGNPFMAAGATTATSNSNNPFL